MTKLFKVELFVVDHENLGDDEIRLLLESEEYLMPHVMKMESVRVDWTDDHPLNNFGTMALAYHDLFPAIKKDS